MSRVRIIHFSTKIDFSFITPIFIRWSIQYHPPSLIPKAITSSRPRDQIFIINLDDKVSSRACVVSFLANRSSDFYPKISTPK